MVKLLLGLVVSSATSLLWAEASLPDPTQPLNFQGSQPAKASYQLNSIFRGAGQTKAIINGQLLAIGQKKGNLELVSVAESSATVRTPEGIHVLYLHPRVKRGN